MSKQDSQHFEPEREAPRMRRKRVAKPYGLRLYWRSFWRLADGSELSFWTKWYSSEDARQKAKKRYTKSNFYVKAEEVSR